MELSMEWQIYKELLYFPSTYVHVLSSTKGNNLSNPLCLLESIPRLRIFVLLFPLCASAARGSSHDALRSESR
jgi:hypothetical protein